MKFTLACAQFAPLKGQVAKNLDRIAEIAKQAVEEGTDLLLLPETVVSGYFLEGGVMENALSAGALLQELASRTQKLAKPIDLALGFYELHKGNLYNSAAYLELGAENPRIVHIYRKFFLPTYGVFDEERFVSRGLELGVFDSRLGRMALLICEDLWHSILASLCAVNGAEVFLVLSASPARDFSGEAPGNVDRYRRMLRAVCEEHGVFCANAQLCGFEGGKGFIGSSSIHDPYGKLLCAAPLAEEQLVVAEIDLEQIPLARATTPLISDLLSSWGEIKNLVVSEKVPN